MSLRYGLRLCGSGAWEANRAYDDSPRYRRQSGRRCGKISHRATRCAGAMLPINSYQCYACCCNDIRPLDGPLRAALLTPAGPTRNWLNRRSCYYPDVICRVPAPVRALRLGAPVAATIPWRRGTARAHGAQHRRPSNQHQCRWKASNVKPLQAFGRHTERRNETRGDQPD